MFGLATRGQQQTIINQQAELMATIQELTDAIKANTAATQQLVAQVQPAATELVQLRSDLAATQPAIDAATAALVGQQPALEAAAQTLTQAVANQPATTTP